MSSDRVPDFAQRANKSVSIFRGRRLPVEAYLAGYAWAIAFYDLPVPLHHEMAAVSPKNMRRKDIGWAIYPAALRPENRLIDHLIFALKYEGLQLLTLKKLFERFDKTLLAQAAHEKPTSGYIRRLCFLFEWLTGAKLDVPDTVAGTYSDLADPAKHYVTPEAKNEKRFRIRNNLPGAVHFCPMVFRTHKIDQYIASDLSRKTREIVESAPADLIARAAAFLLLSDSKASFAIEGEDPPKDRLARWGAVIKKSGHIPLTPEMLVRLQRDLIGDDRFVKLGLRSEGGFVGRHDVMSQPVPEHISARARDLDSLVEGICNFNGMSLYKGFHPVLAAACISFGFIYAHPFEDGNGRLHRFLMHHVLAEHGFTPEQIIFPISCVILQNLARYKDTLESVSRPLLEWIEWRPTEQGNVDVLNDTADYYRYFDATAHCEFLFKCVETAVEKDLPDELMFLEQRDKFHRKVTRVADMSERKLDLLLRFLRQGHGTLSKRAKSNEFTLLTQAEAVEIEKIYAQLFH